MAFLSVDKLAVLQRRFATAALAHQEALEALDDARAAAHVRVLSGLSASLLREGPAGREALLALLDNPAAVVAGMAAVYAIHLDAERCLATLRLVAAEPGLLGFRASVAIERWETGAWTDPPER